MQIDFEKGKGLVPAVIQDSVTGTVLMLGYMNEESLNKTRDSGLVTFYSRSRRKLWTKGEESGNYLHVKEIRTDCDGDTLLIQAEPTGPVCHTGADTCFNEDNRSVRIGFLAELEKVIDGRRTADPDGSYTARLFASGIQKIAQKVGEEATETVIDAVAGNTERLKEETADLLYHLLVLLNASGLCLADAVRVLEKRHSRA